MELSASGRDVQTSSDHPARDLLPEVLPSECCEQRGQGPTFRGYFFRAKVETNLPRRLELRHVGCREQCRENQRHPVAPTRCSWSRRVVHAAEETDCALPHRQGKHLLRAGNTSWTPHERAAGGVTYPRGPLSARSCLETPKSEGCAAQKIESAATRDLPGPTWSRAGCHY